MRIYIRLCGTFIASGAAELAPASTIMLIELRLPAADGAQS